MGNTFGKPITDEEFNHFVILSLKSPEVRNAIEIAVNKSNNVEIKDLKVLLKLIKDRISELADSQGELTDTVEKLQKLLETSEKSNMNIVEFVNERLVNFCTYNHL